MLIGYMRVSKADGSQTTDLQKDALISFGVDESRIYHDHASGKKDTRPGLLECLRALQPGNTLVVWKLDRLGRDLKHLVNVVSDLNDKGIGLKVITGQGANIDTTTSQGRMIFGVFAALAEFERELLIERTNAGLVSARARGRFGGRPRKVDLTTLKLAMSAMSDRSTNVAQIAKKFNVTASALYHYLNKDGTLKEPGKKLLNISVQS